MYTTQNLDNIGFNNIALSVTITKKRVVALYCSIHLRSADCASIVNESAFAKITVLKQLSDSKLI